MTKFEEMAGDREEVYERFLIVYKVDPQSISKMAREINITEPTLRRFLKKETNTHPICLLKILNFVEKKEKRLRDEGKMPL